MANRLIQYRIAAAAVVDAFLPWIQSHARDALERQSPIVVAGHAHQITSLKAKALEHGVTSMGIEWHTVASFRRILFQKLALPFEPLGRENLELLIRVAAEKSDKPLAAALSADPSDALKAMDELGRCGYGAKDWKRVLPDEFSMLGAMLEQTAEWLPMQERACLEQASESSIRIGSVMLFGWGGNHFPDLHLISSLLYLTDDITLLAPQPRLLGSEDVDEAWILQLEALLEVESEFAQDPADWQSRHEGYASSLIMEESGTEAVVPEVQVGHNVDDQACLVADWVQLQSELVQQKEPVGCLVAGEGGSLYRLSTELSRRGIPFHQETGEVLAAGGFHTFHKLLVRCFATGGDIEEVLRLMEWLLARKEASVSGLDYHKLRDTCLRRFSRTPQRSFSELWAGVISKESLEPHEAILLKFAEWLKPWPDRIQWDEARERWSQVALRFGFGADYLEPVWSRLNQHLSGQSIASRYFFEYIESLLGAPGLWRHDANVQPFARVVITTQAAAVGRCWGALVFMDSQEGAWPLPVQENPFLKDAMRDRLNREAASGCTRLLKTTDHTRIQHQMVLGLIENCSGPILFSGSLTDGRAPQVKTFPNEWAAQVLLSSSGNSERALDKWGQAVDLKKSLPLPADMEQKTEWNPAEFELVHASRADPESGIGEYDFQYSEAVTHSGSKYYASSLDSILSAPASYALRQIFDAAPRDLSDFMRQEALLLGIWTHAELASILNQRLHESVKDVLELYRPVVPAQSGLWMSVLAEKASWMVRACLQEIEQLDDLWEVECVEWPAETVSYATSSGEFLLSGRLDLILRTQQGQQLIIDFKTGKTGEVPTIRALREKGAGLQYIAYLILTDQHCTDPKVRVINPFKSQDRELSLDHLEDAQPHFEALAQLAQMRTFPRRGPLRDEYGYSAENLPLTSLPISEDVLDEKWQAFLAGANKS
ncbi:MAG: PD-(D/E)XK nuclease family protein [Verrucomicrobiota bacterium]